MKYLNKIVMVNSAHIPYKEIMLDGNVHFIGTQGVGKSTVLRAILFFYNADKLHLGIPKEKQGFDSFYFPNSNSYIIYEVVRDNEADAYCIMAFRSKGRVAFRFIDAPYQQRWLVDEKLNVRSDWSQIRAEIDRTVSVSPIVSSYKTYLDIIFGNNRSHDLQPYRKYAITESPNYQNIPRTIQNVFLNSKLDADFVKNTIISSIADDELCIDLEFYRRQIGDFEQEYRDMELWFKREKNGEIMIRNLADRVTNAFRDLKYTAGEIMRLRGELGYAVKEAQQQLPALHERATKLDDEIKRHQRLIGEEEEKRRREEIKLNGDLRSVEDNLSKIKTKREHYRQLGIDEIIARVGRKSAVQRELVQAQSLKDTLTAKQRDVVQHFEALIAQLDQDLKSRENELNAAVIAKKNEAANQREALLAQLRKSEDEIRQSFESRQSDAQHLLLQLRGEQEQCRANLAATAKKEPFKKEIDNLNDEIAALTARERELKDGIELQKEKLKSLQGSYELQLRNALDPFDKQASQVREQQSGLNNKLLELDQMRQRYAGSFAEWLDSHRPGWQDNIGKIAHEAAVLYNQDLNPRQATQHDEGSFYGINIDCSAIDRQVLTPKDLDRQIADLNWQISKCAKQLATIAADRSTAEKQLKKTFGVQARAITDQQHSWEYELQQLPARLKARKVDLQSWLQKTAEWREAQNQQAQEQLNEATHRMVDAEKKRDGINAELRRKIKDARSRTDSTIAQLQADVELCHKQAQEQLTQQRKQCKAQTEELQAQQRRELEGKGVDLAAIERCEQRISKANGELEYIEQNSRHVILYEDDKANLFDHETEFASQRVALKDKLTALDNRYRQRHEKLATKLQTLQQQRAQLAKETDSVKSGLTAAEQFYADSTLCPPSLIDIAPRPTRHHCGDIVRELTSKILEEIKKRRDFHKLCSQFTGNFSARNVFHFRTEFASDADYEDFANNLCEFIDNQKIDDFQQEISKRYFSILRRISKEVGDLTMRESEIKKTIAGINADFVKRNFAGVIKKIELRSAPSSDSLMQLLNEIKKFNDDNEFSMGEQNLFSTGNVDEVNREAVRYLLALMKQLHDAPQRQQLLLTDTFKLQFRVMENDNSTDWVEKIANVGSDGTDILVKAMVNIMLINVFKERASKKTGDFKLHCMMDEIGKLHPNNVKGILAFANSRDILLVNSSPTTYNVESYRHTYLLSKDARSRTQIVELIRTL